ncbi:MAG: CopG family transcriptional regulator [Stackebrandtia sp.]
MVKTTVYLPEEMKQRLRVAAGLEGVSEAELIRQAVEARVAKVGRGFKLRRAPLASTALSSENVDEILAEGFGE